MQRKFQLIVFFIFVFNGVMLSQGGKLSKGKESLKPTSSSSSGTFSTSSSSDDSNNSDDSDTSDVFVDLGLGEAFFKILLYLSYGVAAEFPVEFQSQMHDAEIARYPYKKNSHGNFIYADDTDYKLVRFDLSHSFVIDDAGLYGTNSGVNFRFLKRFALDVDYLFLKENVRNNIDTFSLYSVFLKYYRIRTQKFDAWYGIGNMHVGNEVDTSGVGFGFGGEWFIGKPISLEFSYKWANINQNTVHKTKFVLKSYFKNYAVFSGFEQFKIGVFKINAFSIGVGVSF